MNLSDQKYRHELKYVISSSQLVLLKKRIENLLPLDPYANDRGHYTIRSLYFDDYFNRCFYENLNGTDPREKFRIRIYDHSLSRITLECKQKIRGKTAKHSCPITLNQTKQLMQGIPLDNVSNVSPLLQKFVLEMRTRLLKPIVIVEYDRTPFVYHAGNVRVTFDTNISSSSNIADFLSNKISKRPIMPVGHQLLEVKFDEYLPDYIYNSLNLSQLQQTTYSKYFLCRKYTLHN